VRKLFGTAVALVALGTVTAGAAPPSTGAPTAVIDAVLAGHTSSGEPIPCTAREDGVRVCHGDLLGGGDLRLESFDGTPLAVYVTLPPARESGDDGGYPLIVQSHGWGAPPTGPDDPQYAGPTAAAWAAKGYAVVQLTARGWGNSCGTPESRAASPEACEGGYIRLDDVRYEGRDVQHAIGLLVDEGIADPERIGLTGESYGSGVSLLVATLDDRVVEEDGSVRPWTSPDGTPLSIAAAVPLFGWSDLFLSLMPNGRTLDAAIVPTDELQRPGVWKQSIASGLYFVGNSSGYFAPTGADAEADVRTWFETMGAGEPYGPEVADIAELGARYHSPYYLLDGSVGVESQAPPPLLLVGGFTDAVFPVDEQLRYYTRHRQLHPDDPISLLLFDGGHQRAQNKPDDVALLVERVEAFLDHHVGGAGSEPTDGVTVVSQTCPETGPAGEPVEADTWADLHPGEVRFRSEAAQEVTSDAGDATVAAALEPIFGGHACTTVGAADQGDGVATYRLPAATGEGYTMIGAPTVTGDLAVTGSDAYLAARLLDVDPATDTAVLVARGEYRIDPDASGPVTFQLHANAWHFAEGHVPKLELLGQDPDYLRPSNTPFTVEVADLTLQLPVHEVPGAAGTPEEVEEFTPLDGAVDTASDAPADASPTEDSDPADGGTSPLLLVALGLAVVVAVAGGVTLVRRRSPG